MTSDKESQIDNRGSHSVKISITTAATARVISGGWRFYISDLLAILGVCRDTLNTSLGTLEELGAINYQRPAKGRPRKESGGPSITVTVRAENWVWQALGIAPEVGR